MPSRSSIEELDRGLPLGWHEQFGRYVAGHEQHRERHVRHQHAAGAAGALRGGEPVEFSKTFHDDLEATGTGVMLSCGNPQAGAAGYVAIEAVRGRLGDRRGRSPSSSSA